MLDDASIKCWGANDRGQLGLGDTASRGDQPGEMGNNLPAVDLGIGRTAIHLTAGAYYTCALLDDDSAKCWGVNNAGQLGLGDTANRGDQAGEMGNNLPALERISKRNLYFGPAGSKGLAGPSREGGCPVGSKLYVM